MKDKGIVAPKSERKQHDLKDKFSASVAWGPRINATTPATEFNPRIEIDDLRTLFLNNHEIRDRKDGPYITRPMGGDYSRSDRNALPWRLVVADIDEIDADEIPILRRYLTESRLKCFVYSTFSHSPMQPRVRIVFVASREITLEEHPWVHRALKTMVPFSLDDCMAKPSQPIFLPACPPHLAEHAFSFEV